MKLIIVAAMVLVQFASFTTYAARKVSADKKPPVVKSGLKSNISTSKTSFRVSVTDQSAVTTEVYKSGVLIGTYSTKIFDLKLSQGSNNFLIKARDAFQNKAADFVISNVNVDSIAPQLSSSINSNTTTSNSKIQITINDISDVKTKVFKNGTLIKTETSKDFYLDLDPGINNYILKSVDSFSNKASDFFISNVNFNQDSAPPVVVTSYSTGQITNNPNLTVSIQDESNVTTKIFKNGVLNSIETAKSFTIVLNEGVNNVFIESVDSSGQRSELNLSNIVLDTVAPQITSDVPSYSITNKETIRINILDSSFTYTEVSANGIIYGVTDEKAFDIFVFDGFYLVTVTVVDAAGNSSVLDLIEIFADRDKPFISTNLKDKYYFSSLPQTETLEASPSEGVQSVSINGVSMVEIEPGRFSYPFEFNSVGIKEFTFKAVDFGGNESVLQQSVEVLLDTTGPIITTNEIPETISTNIFDLQVSIQDENFRYSEIFVNDQPALSTSEPTYNFPLVFNSALKTETKNVRILAVDSLGNQSAKTFTILKQNVVPVILSNVLSGTTVTENKIHITVTASTSVTTEVIHQEGESSVQYLNEFDLILVPGSNTFILTATDALGNKSLNYVIHEVIYGFEDMTPPQILSYTIMSGMWTSQDKIPIIINDQSTVTTQVFKNGELVATESAKEFELSLTEGFNSFQLIATDAKGQSSTLDLTGIGYNIPGPVVVQPSSGSSTSNPELVIQTSGGVIGNILTAIINSIYHFTGMVGPNGNASLYTTIFEGQNDIELKFTNYDGNTSRSTFFSVILDTIAPEISATRNPDNQNSIRIEINDFSSLVYSSIFIGTDLISMQETKSYDLILESGVEYSIYVMDEAGNTSLLSLTGDFSDTVAPQIITNLTSGTLTNQSKIQISVIDDSNVRTIVFSKDNEIIVNTVEKVFELTLTEGFNSFVIRSKDAFNNEASELTISNIVLDTSTPILTIDLKSNYEFSSLPQVLTVNVILSEPVKEISINDQQLIKLDDLNYFFSFNITQAGSRSFRFVAEDFAGNKSSFEQLVSITLEGQDNQPPQISSSLASNVTTDEYPLMITVTDQSEVTTKVIYSDGTSWTFEKEYQISLKPGPNSFVIESEDVHGNKSNLILSNIFFDPIFGEYYVSSLKSNSSTSATSVKITTFGRSDYPYIWIKRNAQSVYETLLPWKGTYDVPLIEGRNDIVVDFVDENGVSHPFFKLDNIIKDTVQPQILSDIPESRITNKNSLQFNINENVKRVTVEMNGEIARVASLKSFAVFVSEGWYRNIRVVAEDLAGNKTTVNFGDVYVDHTSPVISTDLNQTYEFNSLPQMKTFQIFLSEDVQSVMVNGTELLNIGLNTFTYTVEFQEYGAKEISIIAKDLAGNESSYLNYVYIMEDTDAPRISAELPVFIPSNTYNLIISISDQQDVITRVYDGETEVLTTSEKYFDYTIVFDESQQNQTKVIKIVSVDTNNKTSIRTLAAIKNTAPLSIQVVSPTPNSEVESEEVLIHIAANKTLQFAYINGQPVNIQGDLLTVKGIIYYPKDGDQMINVTVTDIHDESSTLSIPIEIKTTRMPAWDYQECPVSQ